MSRMKYILIGLETWRPVCSFRVKDQTGLVIVIFGRLGRIVFSLIIIIDGIVGDYAFDAVFGVGSFIVPYLLWRIEFFILFSRILQ